MKLGTQNKTFLALCAGPILLVMAASAVVPGDRRARETLSDTTSSEESTDNPANGTSRSTYDDDWQVATLLQDTCDWNTYLCCWTHYDGGQGAMAGNTDVCSAINYPDEGNVVEMPGDVEGDTYCHGMAWPDGADVASHILPLYNYVTNIDRTDDGGYYGNVLGSPECGCIEEMPIVSTAACTRYGINGMEECTDNMLLKQYRSKRAGQPNGKMNFNLVGDCNNDEVPDFDFGTCSDNVYMCCWTENNGEGMEDNTDVCRVGQTEYPEESEGEVHCHGLVWPEDATDSYIQLLAQYVENFDHKNDRGYYGNLPGAPMCGCIEDMPEVSRADCSTPRVERAGKYKACTNNDLLTAYLEEYPGGELNNLVEQCDNEVSS